MFPVRAHVNRVPFQPRLPFALGLEAALPWPLGAEAARCGCKAPTGSPDQVDAEGTVPQ